MSQIFNIFPTTIYVGEVENHNEFKTEFLKLYDKFDYEENEISSTVSEGQVNPLIHLEPSMDVMFQEIVRHIKIYVLDVLKFKDMFNYAITKTWISRTRDKKKYHIIFIPQVMCHLYIISISHLTHILLNFLIEKILIVFS